MVDILRRSSLDGVPEFKTRSVQIATLPALQRNNLRIGAAGLAEAGKAFGVDLPVEACRVAVSGDKAAIWLGPDEWLLLAPEGSAAPKISVPHSLVDISHRQMALEISGNRVEDLLSVGVMLDVRAKAFPVNMAVRTLLGKSEVTLWRREPNVFHIEVWRSFAPYVRAFLEQAAAGV